MNVDWWSLAYDARIEAWKNVATILNIIWKELVSMLEGSDPIQVAFAIVFIIAATAFSGRALLRLFGHLVRYNAIDV